MVYNFLLLYKNKTKIYILIKLLLNVLNILSIYYNKLSILIIQ